jgi:hypothetical protein
MICIMTIAIAFSALTALSACTSYQSVGSMGEVVCNEKGEGVLWAKPNSKGKMDTLKLSKDNC